MKKLNDEGLFRLIHDFLRIYMPNQKHTSPNCIERELRNHGDHRRWSTIKDVLSTHQRTTIIMTDENDQIHHIRSSGIPESEHKELYRILNIKDQLKRNRSVKGKRL